MKDRIQSFIEFRVTIDKSRDITNISQVCTYIRGINETITVKFLELVPKMDTTTADDMSRGYARKHY